MRQPLSFQFPQCAIVLLFLLIFEQATNAEVDQTNSFTPAFSQPSILPNSKIEFSLTLAPDTAASIESATTLTNWVRLQAFTNSSASNSFIATTSVDPTNRVSLFRAVTIPRVAPLSLNGLYLTFTNNPFNSLFFTAETVYRDGFRAESFGRARSFNTWSVYLYSGPADDLATRLTLNFSAPDRGDFLFRYYPSGPEFEGRFMVGPPPPPPQAPLYLKRIAIHTEPPSVEGDSNYILEFTGEASGTFRINQDSYGFFKYEPNGTKAHLRLDYSGPFTGDFNDMTLDFSSFRISGDQIYNRVHGPFYGTFNIP